MKLAEKIIDICKRILGEDKDDHSLWDVFTTQKKYTVKAKVGAKREEVRQQAEEGIGQPIVSMKYKGDFIDGDFKKAAEQGESFGKAPNVSDSGIVLDLREESEGRGELTPEIEKKIIDFVSKTSNLDDSDFHSFVQSLGVDPHEAEEVAYRQIRILSKSGKKGSEE